MIRSLGVGVLLSLSFNARAQLGSAALGRSSMPADTVSRPRFGRAAFQFGLAEILPWTVDRYVRNVDYAHISLRTVGHNLLPSSWTWDDDAFGTNQFAHPYHGSLYFSSFRANGYSFWQSAPATLAGSYLWETAAEKQYPSPNDFINTSFGGIILGEVTYRLSNQIVNNHTRGFKRQLSEVLALMVNPMNGFSRITRGKWGKVERNTRERDSTQVEAEFDLGIRQFNAGQRPKTGWFGHVKLRYGTPFERYRTPFSNISVDAEFGNDDSSKVSILSVYGSLAGWQIRSSGRLQQLATLSANYDYIHNEAFFYSAQSIKFNLFTDVTITRRLRITSALAGGPVLLAAVPDQYLFKGRNYDYGAGAGVNANVGLVVMDKIFCRLNYRGGLLKTINGNQSHYVLQAVTGEIGCRFTDQLSIGVEPGCFNLHGTYQHFEPVNHQYPYLRASLRYGLTFH